MTATQDEADGATTSPRRLGEVMSRVARELREEHGDVEATLHAIATRAVRVVPNAEECSISYVIGPKKVEPRASTSDFPKEVDALELRLGQGPSLDAVWEQEIIRVDDVGADDRWPQFAHEASALGVGQHDLRSAVRHG